MMFEKYDPNLVDHLTGKKLFFPVFVSSTGKNKVFTDKNGMVQMKPMFVSQEDALKWCKNEGVTPVGLVHYDISCEPLSYEKLSQRQLKKDKTTKKGVIKSDKKKSTIKRTTKKYVKKKTSTTKKQAVNKKSNLIRRRIRRTNAEIEAGMSLEEVIKQRELH